MACNVTLKYITKSYTKHYGNGTGGSYKKSNYCLQYVAKIKISFNTVITQLQNCSYTTVNFK